jgi:hypothetical protein
VLHLGYQSLLDVMFVFLVALLFALVTEWTRSIWGASLAHDLTNVALFLVFPFIIGQGLQLPGIFTERLTPAVQMMGELPTPATSEAAPTAAAVIVDSGDPGFIPQGSVSLEGEQAYQGHLVWAMTRSKRPDVFMAWEPAVPANRKLPVIALLRVGNHPAVTIAIAIKRHIISLD